MLLEYVRRKREESLFDRVCVATALAAARDLPGAPHLSVNVHASTLGRDQGFVPFLAGAAREQGIEAPRVTLEIVEHAPPWDGLSFLNAIAGAREQGMSVALDDVGLGQSNYKMILDARPDYFKLDRYFVKGAHSDVHRQAVLESVAQLALRFGGRVVAEGVEDTADLETAMRYGIDLIQGFLFSRPLPRPDLLASGALDLTVAAPVQSQALPTRRPAAP